MTQSPDPYSTKPPNDPTPPNIPPPMTPPPVGDVPEGAYMGPPPTKDEQNMGMLCYILAIFGILGWIGPLVIWLSRKETSPFLNDQGAEVLNWELTLLIAYVGLGIFGCIPLIGLLAWVAIVGVLITNLVFCILGAMQASKGSPYRMPFSIKFVK